VSLLKEGGLANLIRWAEAGAVAAVVADISWATWWPVAGPPKPEVHADDEEFSDHGEEQRAKKPPFVPWRSEAFPWGRPDLHPKVADRVREASAAWLGAVSLAAAAARGGGAYAIMHPRPPWLEGAASAWKQECARALQHNGMSDKLDTRKPVDGDGKAKPLRVIYGRLGDVEGSLRAAAGTLGRRSKLCGGAAKEGAEGWVHRGIAQAIAVAIAGRLKPLQRTGDEWGGKPEMTGEGAVSDSYAPVPWGHVCHPGGTGELRNWNPAEHSWCSSGGTNTRAADLGGSSRAQPDSISAEVTRGAEVGDGAREECDEARNPEVREQAPNCEWRPCLRQVDAGVDPPLRIKRVRFRF